jgi:ATP-dependent helicase/nuclease subunit A
MAEQLQLKQRQATCPVSHTWVDASAGTGKTKILTDRILRFLLNQTPASNILALTFTKAAAIEMKTRILDRLSRWAIMDDSTLANDLMTIASDINLSKARSLFTEVLDCPGGLKIQTIHQFCQDLLNRFPLEAQIPVHYTLMNESESHRLIHQMIDQLLHTEDLSQILDHYSYAYVQECLVEILLSTEFQSLPLDKVRQSYGVDLSVSQADMISRFCNERPDWSATIPLLETGGATDQKLAKVLKQPQNYQDYISGFLTQDGEIRKKLMSKNFPEILAEAEVVYAFNTKLKKLMMAQLSYAFYRLASKVMESYQRHKEAQALMDFDDLILKTTNLLSTEGIAPWILYKLDDHIDHILVDEAQDTNPLQWQIILKLAEDFFSGQSAREVPRTLFIVGDYKQSIYSFQGADPDLFRDLKQVMAEKASGTQQPWQNISLDISFRSCQAVLDVVDAVFQDTHHESCRPLDGGKIELWPITQDEDNQDNPYALTASQILARQIASEIKQWLNEQRLIPAKGRSIEPKDIMILVQRRHSFMYELIRALKKKHIPVAGPDRMNLVDQLYIQDLIAFGRFLLLPNDDYNLACLLKSPLFNMSEEDLMELCVNRDDRSLWSQLNQPKHESVHALLSSYLNKVDYLTPYQIYAHLLCVSQGRQKFFTRFEHEIADGLDEFLNLALEFETTSAASLELFLDELTKMNPEIKRDFSSSDLNAVRITTVHGAKGLQAPIIILPDTTIVPKTLPSLLWDDVPLWNAPKSLATEEIIAVQQRYQTKQSEEHRRLLYVALTRAEDELYVSGWENHKEPPENCWYNLIRQGMQSIGAQEINNKLVIETPQQQTKKVQLTKIDKPSEHIPAWLFEPAKQEKISTRFLSPSQVGQTSDKIISPLDQQNTHSFQDGLILHKLLELLPNLPPAKPEHYTLIKQIMDDPTLAHLFGAHSYAEVPIAGTIDGEKFSGQIDRLIVLENEIIILDFKSDQNPPSNPSLVDARYRQQLAVYKQLLQQIYPRHNITCQILWIRTKSLMTIPIESKEIRHAVA